MKRKRGHKKGKPKPPTTTTNTPTTNKSNPVIDNANETPRNVGSQNKEETSNLDDHEFCNDKEDNSGTGIGMEVDTPSSTGTDQQHYNLANINPDGSIDKALGKSVGRVKVKLRTSKMLDSQSQPTSSDAPTQSDTDDKSSQQLGFEKQVGVNQSERMEDSANSLPEMKSGAPSKRAGSIKIKSSKVLGSNANAGQTGKGLSTSAEITHLKERKAPQQNPRYSKQELDAALVVIRKVMKMDAAEPFNVPVNPEALGIPDYFDIIDTPMDFGTICSNLEKKDKYMNSEDVFKDVQYIWDNCYKYNNKGDYILDLMRRVKKNFMKYWTAAGLYNEQAKGTKGLERTSAEDIALSSEGKVGKSGQLKQKTKKRHGRHHKHDCLCAICVLKRRRKEREENARIAKGNFGSGGDKLAKEFKQEESVPVESPGGEDSSSNMDDSLGTDVDADEDKGEVVKTEISEKQCNSSEGKHEDIDIDVDDDDDDDNDHGHEEGGEEEDEDEEEDGEIGEEEIDMDSQKRQKDETSKQSQLGGILAEKSNVEDATFLQDEYKTTQQDGQAAVVQQHKHKESQDKRQKAKLFERLCFENPQLSSLCGILFPKNSQSVWSGSHSLLQRQNSGRTSSIHAAINTFME